MSVLITRPSPAGDELVTLLEQHNIAAFYTPLIKFTHSQELEYLIDKLDALSRDDLIFAISYNAVKYAHEQLKRNNYFWPSNLRYFGIGQKTALFLEKMSQCKVHYPRGREITEHLIELSELQNVVGKKALILRGNGGRDLLSQTLQHRGADVSYCECYQRIPIDYNRDDLVNKWQEHNVDTILITSYEMLQLLYNLVPEYKRVWLTTVCRLVVVSQRIASYAYQLGWQKLISSII